MRIVGIRYGSKAGYLAAIAVVLILAAPPMRASDEHDAFESFLPPLGLPSIASPPDNPLASDKIALGAKLFSDPRLSRDATMSCASCHDPAHAFTRQNVPIHDTVLASERLRRNVPSLLNVAYAAPLHHDGREPTLEVQILSPLFNPAEMANTSFDDLTERLATIPEYRDAFLKIFAAPPTIETLGQALASFERSLMAGDSPFDRWRYAGDGAALSAAARAGLALFTGKAGCVACHTIEEKTALFTNNRFVNTGIGFQSEQRRAHETPHALTDRGREEITHVREDRYKFRTPTLRNVALTAPYMHDGSINTLDEIVANYNAGGSADPGKDPRIKPLGLTDDEQQALVAFLISLRSKTLPGTDARQ